jgi:hypothetical protein
VPVFELLDGRLLQLAADGELHVEVRGQLHVAPHRHVYRLRHGLTRRAEEGTLKARIAALGT